MEWNHQHCTLQTRILVRSNSTTTISPQLLTEASISKYLYMFSWLTSNVLRFPQKKTMRGIVVWSCCCQPHLSMTSTDETLLTDLEAACTSGNLEKVQALFADHKICKSSPDIPVQTLLQLSARNSHPKIVTFLLQHGAIVDSSTVVSACTSNSTDIFQALLDAGFNLNESIGHPGDALILCAGANKVPLVKWLLDHGADPNANLVSLTRSALDVAVIHASTEVAGLLLQHGAETKGVNSLKLAAAYGRLDMIPFLLDHGVGIDEIPENEYITDAEREAGLGTALHEAAKSGQASAVSLLLDRGADPGIKDSRGKTALECAKELDDLAVVKAFQKRAST